MLSLTAIKQILRLTLLVNAFNAGAADDQAAAENIVKNSVCIDGKRIEDALKDKIKMRSQRDLGWQVFNEDGRLEVERAFLMNKSMQLRFRWRVDPGGSVHPVSSRAESLCVKE